MPLRVTNEDGRTSAFLTWDQFLCAHYKMRFEVGEYFASHGVETFFPYTEVRLGLHSVIKAQGLFVGNLNSFADRV